MLDAVGYIAKCDLERLEVGLDAACGGGNLGRVEQ